MPSSRPSSSGGRRPPNATATASEIGSKRSNSAVNLNNRDHTQQSLNASASSSGMQRKDSEHSEGGNNSGSGNNDDGGPSTSTRRATSSAHHHTHHKVGPKRKSKVGISGLADQSHFGHSRKKNASSTGLARRDKSRSHLALTHVASELSALSQMQQPQQQQEATLMSSSRSGRSKERKTKSHRSRSEDEEAPSSTTTATTTEEAPLVPEGDDNENEAGWISATSSAAATPLAGTSPMSPESYKALEFGKKSRRKKAAPAAEHVQPLDFPKYEQRPHVQRTATEEEDMLGTTPRQRESALSLAAPKNLASVSSLSQLADSMSTANSRATNDSRDSGVVMSSSQAHSSSQAQSSTNTSTSTSDTRPQPAESNDRIHDLPRLPENSNQRPSTMRKSSTSTIRSLASVSGSRSLNASIRRQTLTPLQPRLDTSAEGLGELKHVGLTPKQNDVGLPSEQSTNGPRTHRRQHSGASLGAGSSSKAGTLSPQEAEELAKRLRTVSGSDIPASSEPDSGQHPVRGTLRRSASTAQGTTLASLQKYGISSPRNEQPPSSTAAGTALGTLKRASGYFGSISRLTSLGSTLGLTSLDRDSHNQNAAPSPSSPGFRRTPSSGGSMAAAQSSTSPMQRLQGAYGLRGSRNTAAPQVRQPLISKFIDPSESYQPFPKASTSPSTTTRTNSQNRHPGIQRGATSRARQKLLTQRDYPDEYGMQQQLMESNASGFSDDDPMASQVNLRKNLSSKNLSGAATPLQPGVQRWLVALSKEAERIDKEHETFFRFHDTMQLSFARILERRALEEQEEIKAWKERNATANKA